MATLILKILKMPNCTQRIVTVLIYILNCKRDANSYMHFDPHT